jgi:cytochrome c oxidase assembly protein subunit 15
MPFDDQRLGAADVLTIGFGTTVVMWSLAYFCRLFGSAIPAPLVFALLIACLLAGGTLAGRYSRRGVRSGLYAGLLSGTLNLLIVGSLIGGRTPNEIKRGALLWVPGTLVLSAILGSLGAALGRTRVRPPVREPDWPGLFAAVAACAAFMLLGVGGLVTGFDAGLAVPDWPNTEGYNMFLYPLSRMTGGIYGKYLEHAHRLLGSLVGLTTLVLAVHTQVTDRRRWLRTLAWLVLGLVIVQGILGGLRVTGHPTLSSRPSDTSPSIVLAIVHGVVGQLVFAALVAVAVFRSRAWRENHPVIAPTSATTDRVLGVALLVLLIGQLVLGALVRHLTWPVQSQRFGLVADPAQLVALGRHMLHLHVAIAVLVALLTVGVGVRAWGLYPHLPPLPRLGASLLVLIATQVALGIAALVVTGNVAPNRRPQALDVAITTAHQLVGAVLLAWALMVALWNYRLIARGERLPRRPAPSPESTG